MKDSDLTLKGLRIVVFLVLPDQIKRTSEGIWNVCGQGLKKLFVCAVNYRAFFFFLCTRTHN